jgi:hypothetical protein
MIAEFDRRCPTFYARFWRIAAEQCARTNTLNECLAVWVINQENIGEEF